MGNDPQVHQGVMVLCLTPRASCLLSFFMVEKERQGLIRYTLDQGRLFSEMESERMSYFLPFIPPSSPSSIHTVSLPL